MEKLVRHRVSRAFFIYNYLLASLVVVFLLAFFLLFRFPSWIQILVGYIGFLLVLVLVLKPEFNRIYRYYVIEDNQVSMVEGIITRKRLSIPYEKITDTSVIKTFLGRILNYGDITVSGISNKITMSGMKNPYKIHQSIQEKISSLGKPAKRKKQQ